MRRAARLLALWLVALAAPAQPPAREIFGTIDAILQDLQQITGFRIHHRVPAEMITRDKVKDFVSKRLKEVTTPEEVRIEELILKKFGLAPQDFDLAANTVDLLTEQAAAFYDFHQKKLYITDWTPSATREPALVHELAHALADQNFNLDKYIKKGRKSDDGALARMAVMEGQASWVMAEYLARKMGQSLATSPTLVDMWANSIESGAGQYPVFEHEPLYLRETLVFPYTKGLVFQNRVYQRDGKNGLSKVFRRPPVSTQQILHPEAYFAADAPVRPELPKLPDSHGYKRIAEGTLGELDHAILIEQYCGREEAAAVSPHWRGAGYALEERRAPARVILEYVSQWDDAAAATRYFRLYRQVLEKKWKHIEVQSESDSALAGLGDDGYFRVEVAGPTMTAIQGAENPIPVR